MKNIIFFRNDDVRNKLDDSLIELTMLFISHEIPLTHAVEPANITKEVAEWLLQVKKEYPDLIDIMQHGYDHTVKNKFQKGEFGGQRTYIEQFNEIKRGKELMDNWFGELWFSAFNFPYAPYNLEAIKALDDCGFKVINSHFNSRVSRRIFYLLGHSLNKGFFLNHHVSWNLNFYPNTKLFEIDVNTGFIKKYYNELYDCEMLNLSELKKETSQYLKYKTIGVLLHHRYHNSENKIKLVNEYLKWCKSVSNFEFWSLKNIYETFAKN